MCDVFVEKFKRLNVNRSGGRSSPHKPCLLLTVIDLIEAGVITENRIVFDDVLLSRYAEYFSVVRSANDHPNPWMPFFHLKSDGIWHLMPLPGRDAVLAALNTAVKRTDITANVSHAYLDERLYECLMISLERDLLRDVLLYHWFSDFVAPLSNLIGVTEFEKSLRAGEGKGVSEAVPARSAAFRRLVLEAYDFRCAASGWRFILPEGPILVEAAHLVPFSESHDDRPNNGIALAPTYHWAMDNRIIAPGPDGRWHVSRLLDDRIPDHRELCQLRDKPVLAPTNAVYSPDKSCLQWRVESLLD